MFDKNFKDQLIEEITDPFFSTKWNYCFSSSVPIVSCIMCLEFIDHFELNSFKQLVFHRSPTFPSQQFNKSIHPDQYLPVHLSITFS